MECHYLSCVIVVEQIWNLCLEVQVKMEDTEKSSDDAHKKANLLEELGDLCCKLKAYAPALKFFGEQVRET